MQLLAEQHRAAHPVGRIALSVLLFQDMMVVPILFIVGLLVRGAEGGILNLIAPFAQALAVVVAIMLAGRFVVRPLLRSAVRTGSRDLIIAITLLILVVFSTATGLAGLSVALGAFLAGLLLSDSEARHQIEVDLEPFKGLLLGIFFITVGTALDLGVVANDLGWIALCVVALIAVKAAILFGIAFAFGIPRGNAIEVSLLLAQAGEFAFIVLAQAGNLVPPRLAAGAAAVAALTMLLTPLLAMAARRLAQRFPHGGRDHDHLRPKGAIDLEDHVVIGGHGRVGAMIAQALDAENVPYVVLDTDPQAILGLRNRGRAAYFGDAVRAELLRRIGAERARAFVVTVNDSRAAEQMVVAARRIQQDAIVFARAKDAAHARRLAELGAQAVVPETVEASLQLTARLLEFIDLPEEAVADRIRAMRAAEVSRQARSAAE
jgi:CPA2 family monovalent cation:H+ antiporter-2